MKAKRYAVAGWLVCMAWLGAGNALAFYNPSTGRWLNRDKIGENGGENLYSAMANAPLSKVDLFGLCLLRPCGSGSNLEFFKPVKFDAWVNVPITSPALAKALCQARIDSRLKPPLVPRPSRSTCPQKCGDLLDKALQDDEVKELLAKFPGGSPECEPPRPTWAPFGGFAGGGYNDRTFSLVLNCDYLTDATDVKNTLLHELTHGLQRCYLGMSTGCGEGIERELEAYYCRTKDIGFEHLINAALGSACGLSCPLATDAENAYQKVQDWFNKNKDDLCKFPRKPRKPSK
jgi:hypothetical protein